jgi:intein-encoded DNA endonuclease-like protein
MMENIKNIYKEYIDGYSIIFLCAKYNISKHFMYKEFDLAGFKIMSKEERYALRKNEICKNLITYGVIPNKTFIIKFPEWMPDDLLPHFIRGYFDGDGCFYIDKKKRSAFWSVIGSSQFCLKLSEIINSKLGIVSYISHDKRAKIGIDMLRIRKYSDIKKICNWIYDNSTINLDRKYNKFLEIQRIKNDIL